MSGSHIADLSLREFFVGPPAIRVEDEKINETEYGHEGALDDYLVKGPGEWGYPEELARNGPEDAACVAYRDRVVARFESRPLPYADARIPPYAPHAGAYLVFF